MGRVVKTIEIEGLDFDTSVVPVDSLGKAKGHHLDAIRGAITMEAWEITIDPNNDSLGLEGRRRREFTEYEFWGRTPNSVLKGSVGLFVLASRLWSRLLFRQVTVEDASNSTHE